MWLSTPPGCGKKKSLTMAMLYGILRAQGVGKCQNSIYYTRSRENDDLVMETNDSKARGNFP